jgi:hypothetical protein
MIFSNRIADSPRFVSAACSQRDSDTRPIGNRLKPMPEKGWRRTFDDPIPLPGCRQLLPNPWGYCWMYPGLGDQRCDLCENQRPFGYGSRLA